MKSDLSIEYLPITLGIFLAINILAILNPIVKAETSSVSFKTLKGNHNFFDTNRILMVANIYPVSQSDSNQIVDFTFSPDSNIRVNETVTFYASSSIDDDKIMKYTWRFGDGSLTGSGKITSHVYAEPRDYYVFRLTVTCKDGLTYNVTKEPIKIGPVPPGVENDSTPPVANFSLADKTYQVYETITFNAERSSDYIGIAR